MLTFYSIVSLLANLQNINLSVSTEKIIVEYIWISRSENDLRSKARTLSGPVTDPTQLPKWNYDGSSTGQAPDENSEVILYPQAIFKDPFRGGDNIMVVCDAYTPEGEPIPTNKRFNVVQIFSHPEVAAEEPWYGINQEYTLCQKNDNWPLGWEHKNKVVGKCMLAGTMHTLHFFLGLPGCPRPMNII